MTSAERNYDADESEMLAIVKACKQWRHYVENAKHQILIITDHVNLRTFLIIKILSRRKIRWWEKFSELDLLIEYRSKRLNSADAFSRQSDYAIDSAKSEVQCIVTNSSILNDTSQSTRESRLASKKSSTRNVIAICKWFLTREQKSFDEDKISINKQMIELLNNVRLIFTIIEAIKKSFRKKRTDAIRKRLENDDYESDTFVFLDDAKCVNRKIVEKIAIINDVFVSRFLKLRIAFLALQKNDQLAQRMRFHCAESQLMKRNFENQNEDDLNVDTQSSSEDDAIAQRICNNWRLNDDLVCFKNVWYVFADFMRRLLLKQNHDDFHANHFDVKRTLELLKRKYYWFAMSQDVKKYVNACFACHRIKTIKHKFFEQLQSIFMLKKSRLEWIMNFIIDLSFNVNRRVAYDSILVLVDRYTKYARYIRTKQNWIAVQLVDAMIEELFIKCEIFEVIITDRESLFISKYWSAFCYHLKLALRYSIAFHSQTDDQTERQNQTLEQYLRNYVNYQQNDWTNWLAFVE